MSEYRKRIERVQQSLREGGYAGAVIAPSDQMRYLSGWAEYGHERLIALLLPAAGDPVFVVPSIHLEQMKANPAGIRDILAWSDSTGWHGVVRDVLGGWDVDGRRIAIDDELYAVHLLAIQRLLRGAPCDPAGDLMARMREVKSDEELERMCRSARVTDEVYEECLGSIREGMTELELREVIADGYRRLGTKPAFAIIGFGPNGALPHHSTGTTRLKKGDVIIIDIGCTLEDYQSDITRTIAFGEPGQEARTVYDVVLKAHRAAFAAGRPGVACEDVDAAARHVIDDAGYGDYFIHRTGHGIGMSGHESPYIVEGNIQKLEPGMCFSDEPGIYLPGRFGVRIENIVTVTAEGLRYLNAEPPSELLVIGKA